MIIAECLARALARLVSIMLRVKPATATMEFHATSTIRDQDASLQVDLAITLIINKILLQVSVLTCARMIRQQIWQLSLGGEFLMGTVAESTFICNFIKITTVTMFPLERA